MRPRCCARRVCVAGREPAAPTPLVDPSLQLLVTPAPDHKPFVDAIDGAKASIELAMFHLTDARSSTRSCARPAAASRCA